MNAQLASGKDNVRGYQSWDAINQDTNFLLHIFPEEMWLFIVDRIKNPDILFNLAECTPFWRRLLHPRRTEYLLPQVLEVLATENYFSREDRGSLYMCRLVCKSWKAGADALLEKGADVNNPQLKRCGHVLLNEYPFQTYFGLYQPAKFNRIKTEVQEAVGKSEEFRQKNVFLYSPSNIFPSRRLDIDEYDVTFSQPMNPDITQILAEYRSVGIKFLEAVGHHFWHVKISLVEMRDMEEWYNRVHKLVSLLPNLHYLSLDYAGNSKVEPPSPNLKPFPTRSSLQMLCLQGVPPCVVSAVLRANPQIKVLNSTGVNCAKFDLQVLTSLHTLYMSVADATDLLSQPNAHKLKRLRLEFYSLPKRLQIVPWSTIFGKLSEWHKETLVELSVRLPCIDVSDESPANIAAARMDIWRTSMKPLNLPNVKMLELYMGDSCSLDFLLGLQSLEHLRLFLANYSGRSVVESTVITFDYLSPDFSCKCNIWQLIPSLNRVDLDCVSASSRTFRRPSTNLR